MISQKNNNNNNNNNNDNKKSSFSVQKPLAILLITFKAIVSLEKLSSKAYL